MRSADEIEAEIRKLRQISHVIPAHSAHDGDLVQLIQAQIHELVHGHSQDQWLLLTNRHQEVIVETDNWKRGDSENNPSGFWQAYSKG